MRFPVVIYREQTGGFSVVCPTLPGCHSQGETLDEALSNVREAIELCLEVRQDDGMPVPGVREPVIALVEIAPHREARGGSLSVRPEDVGCDGVRCDSADGL